MKPRYLRQSILAADMVGIALAMMGADLLRYGTHWDLTDRLSIHALLPYLVLSWVTWLTLSSWMRLDCFSGGWRFPAVVSQLLVAIVCLMSSLLTMSYLAKHLVSRLALGYFAVLLFIGFLIIRYVARLILRARYATGAIRRVVIAGTGNVARELARKIHRHPETLCKVVGFLAPDDVSPVANISDARSAVSVSTLGVVDLLAGLQVDELILALPRPAWTEVLNLAGRCRETGINVSIVPQPYELYLSKPQFLDLDGLPILQLHSSRNSSLAWAWWKRAADIVLGAMLSLVAIPILLPAALVLRWTKGKAFCWDVRSGQLGVPFGMLRLNVDRPVIQANRFERVLDMLGITELPQLWNVLRGHMSLVGPRPESFDRVKCYSEWQRQRLCVKPGITGLAQVHGLRDEHSSEEKTRFDLQYLLSPSPLSDVSLLLQTLWTLAMRVVRWPRSLQTSASLLSTYPVPPSELVPEAFQGAHRSQSSAD
jgi:lipopolysaccharide/colanic/teichoic acid biosynthesis glycosyltransferase